MLSILPRLGNTPARRGGWVRGGWVRVLSRVPSSSRPARWSSGCAFARWGHRRCLYPCGPGTRRSGEWSRPGVGVAGRVPSSLRGVRGVLLGPVGGSATVVGVRVVCLPGGAIDGVYTPAAREHTGRGNGAALGAGSRVGVVGRVLLLSSSVWWVGPPCGVRVGCGVSGRLVRRRCRSGRCAGGTRGRGRTAQWWPPRRAGSVSRP